MKANARLLLIDDDTDLVDTMSAILELWEFQVDAIHSGTEALRAVQERQYHAALIDISLPDIDGYRLASALRAQSPSGLLLIGFSGFNEDKEQERIAGFAFDYFLTKPVDLDFLSSILRHSS
jgi:DNA-binding response OmpR family regulator